MKNKTLTESDKAFITFVIFLVIIVPIALFLMALFAQLFEKGL